MPQPVDRLKNSHGIFGFIRYSEIEFDILFVGFFFGENLRKKREQSVFGRSQTKNKVIFPQIEQTKRKRYSDVYVYSICKLVFFLVQNSMNSYK